MTPQLTLPDAGITDGTVLLRMPVVDDVDALLPSFADPALREAGNLPDFDRPQMLAMLPSSPRSPASGRLLPLIAIDPRSGDCVGGGTLHHLDAERSIIEIGYWVLPAARRRGYATRIARLLAEHAFSLGVDQGRRVRERRQPRVGAGPRAGGLRAGGRGAVDAGAQRRADRQDAVLVP